MRHSSHRTAGSRDQTRRAPRHVLIGAFLLIVVLAVYGRTIATEFVEFDDGVTVYLNPGLNPPSWGRIAGFWKHPYKGIYAPVTFTVYSLEAWLSPRSEPDSAGREMDATVFHAGNVVIHGVCVLLVFALLRGLVESDLAAGIGSLVFAVHPLQVETVAWVTQMRGLLATAFGLAAVLLYVRAWSGPAGAAPRIRTWAAYGAATLCFGLALLSKPAAAAVPLVVAVIEVVWLGAAVRRVVLTLVPWFGLAAAVAVITQRVQPGFDLPVTTAAERCCVAGDAFAFYVMKVFWPVHLAPIYDRPLDHVIASATFCWRWFIAAALVLAAIRLPGKRASLTTIGIFGAALAPVLGFVPFEYQSMATVADRYAHLALLGPAFGIAALVAASRSGMAFAVSGAAIVTLASVSFAQAGHWRDDDSLLAYGLRLNPGSPDLHTGAGNLAFRRGDFDTAERAYRTALAADPRDSTAHRNLGLILEQRGQTGEAIDHFRRAIEARPDFAEAQRSLARVLVKINELAAAVEPYRQAIALEPDDRAAYAGLGVTLLRMERASEAEAVLREAVARFPDWAEAHANLAAALGMQDRNAEAAQEAREALRLKPDLAEAKDTLQKVQESGERR